MTPDPATYPGYRFPAEINSHAVSLYHVFSLGLRDVEAGARNWLMPSM
jgi:putative transposase